MLQKVSKNISKALWPEHNGQPMQLECPGFHISSFHLLNAFHHQSDWGALTKKWSLPLWSLQKSSYSHWLALLGLTLWINLLCISLFSPKFLVCFPKRMYPGLNLILLTPESPRSLTMVTIDRIDRPGRATNVYVGPPWTGLDHSIHDAHDPVAKLCGLGHFRSVRNDKQDTFLVTHEDLELNFLMFDRCWLVWSTQRRHRLVCLYLIPFRNFLQRMVYVSQTVQLSEPWFCLLQK